MNVAQRGRKSGRQRGFVLILTIVILAAVTVAATIFAQRVGAAVALAQQVETGIEDQLAMADARAEVLFRLATVPISIYGLGILPGDSSIALDNRRYRTERGVVVQLQDNRGLANLNIITDDRLLRLLGSLGVSAERRNVLVDMLRDYQDEDSLKRLNGAEAPEYLEAKMPPPRNEKLLTPYEAKNIMGWRDETALWEQNHLAEFTTTANSVAMNPNTAPWQVLMTLPGITREMADALIARRKLAPINSEAQVAQYTGIDSQTLALQIIALPADGVRATYSMRDAPSALQENVSLTPGSNIAPWRIDYHYRIAVASKNDRIEAIPALPQRTTFSTPTSPTILTAP